MMNPCDASVACRSQRVAIQDLVRGQVSWDAEATVGDFILLRSTGIPVYNFCVAGEKVLDRTPTRVHSLCRY